MKKTHLAKPLQVAVFVAEAQRLGGSVSSNQRRFMSAAKQKGLQMEPTGLMAGIRA
jgi:hypothetical protein